MFPEEQFPSKLEFSKKWNFRFFASFNKIVRIESRIENSGIFGQ
jgi:hypothetical protein